MGPSTSRVVRVMSFLLPYLFESNRKLLAMICSNRVLTISLWVDVRRTAIGNFTFFVVNNTLARTLRMVNVVVHDSDEENVCLFEWSFFIGFKCVCEICVMVQTRGVSRTLRKFINTSVLSNLSFFRPFIWLGCCSPSQNFFDCVGHRCSRKKGTHMH